MRQLDLKCPFGPLKAPSQIWRSLVSKTSALAKRKNLSTFSPTLKIHEQWETSITVLENVRKRILLRFFYFWEMNWFLFKILFKISTLIWSKKYKGDIKKTPRVYSNYWDWVLGKFQFYNIKISNISLLFLNWKRNSKMKQTQTKNFVNSFNRSITE